MANWHARSSDSIECEDSSEELPEASCCRIVILGVGEDGSNIVNRLTEMDVAGARCIVLNKKTIIGKSRAMIETLLSSVDVVFITASLGDATENRVAPIVAEIARSKGAVVIGVVTAPFKTGKERTEHAARALKDIRRACDTVVVVDNDKILERIRHLPPSEASKVTDQALANLIKNIVETISAPSWINFDLADFKTFVRNGGFAVVGVGESDAPNRAEEAVRSALGGPLLDVLHVGAKGALVHVSGNDQMTIEEANRVGQIVTEIVGEKASVLWGAKVDPRSEGFLKVTLVMTGAHSLYTSSWFGNIMPKLYDLESPAEPEKLLQIDLGLDQIEDFEE